MSFIDLREFLNACKEIGELKEINGAHWDLEIGCITELMAERDGPMLLFDNIQGYPPGFRVVSNFISTPKRFALAMGMPIDAPPMEIVKLWRENLDPGLSPEKKEKGDLTIGRALDACKPFSWKDKFPVPNIFSNKIREEILKKWEKEFGR